ncbi:DUF1385 domain-containing protein [bacterium]|nr:MAG: DUF1385 domain-containing protein [bacterium]
MPKGEYLQYGGQAIIEGVMMRSPHWFAVACRAPNKQIIVHTEHLEKTWVGRQKWLKWPFFRGSFALLETMGLGVKAMRFASRVQMDPMYAEETSEEAGKPMNTKVQDLAIGSTLVFSLGMGVLIFNYLPNLLSESLRSQGFSGTLINFITEVIKIALFLGYMYAIGRLPDIQRVFQYHGAEHKAINAMEANRPLTVEETAVQTRLHPRCGTSFAIVVLLVSMVIFTFVPRYPFGEKLPYLYNVTARFFVEMLVLPIISGIAYEIIRIAGKFKNSAAVQALLWPGLMSQYLTTREPDAEHMEVALAALQAVVNEELKETGGGEDIALESAPLPA